MKRSPGRLLPPLLLALISAASCNMSVRSEPGGGSELLLQIETGAADRDRLVEQTIRIIEARADAVGANVKLERAGPDKITLRIGAAPEMERVKKVLLAYARLEFRPVVSPPSPSTLRTYSSFDEGRAAVKDGEELLPFVEQPPLAGRPGLVEYVIVKTEPLVANEDVRSAQAVPADAPSYEITFSLKPEGAARFGEWTAANINNYLAVVLNKEVKSVASIRGQITDSGVITGAFSREEAEDLALVLRSGSMPAPIKILEERTFGK